MEPVAYAISGALIGFSAGVFITDRWWKRVIDKGLTKLSQNDRQLKERLGMNEYCINSGCHLQEIDDSK